MKKHYISRAKLIWRFIEGIVSCCVLKFKYRLIINENTVSTNISKDWNLITRDITAVLEKVKGEHERQQKKQTKI